LTVPVAGSDRTVDESLLAHHDPAYDAAVYGVREAANGPSRSGEVEAVAPFLVRASRQLGLMSHSLVALLVAERPSQWKAAQLASRLLAGVPDRVPQPVTYRPIWTYEDCFWLPEDEGVVGGWGHAAERVRILEERRREVILEAADALDGVAAAA
jgi:hypothetical protein